ncbi:MAG: CbtB-domain containing protein [Chloroflexi bacterium]|nr:CbtB-domain containing protein [Chloroflexota bacterium]
MNTAYRYASRVQTVTLNVAIQVAILLAISALVIWTLLFSSYPIVHDPVHALRHALYMIPCH